MLTHKFIRPYYVLHTLLESEFVSYDDVCSQHIFMDAQRLLLPLIISSATPFLVLHCLMH